MGDILHKMQVIIEGNAKPLKKELESSRQEVKHGVEAVQKETEKMKNPFRNLTGNKTLNSVKDSMRKVKASFASFSLKDKTREFQIKAGIKVPTEEYQNVENLIVKLQRKMKTLSEYEKALSEMGHDQGMSEQYRKINRSMKETETELSRLKEKQQELQNSGKSTELTSAFRELSQRIEESRAKLSSLEAERSKRQEKKMSMLDVTEDGKLYNINDEIAKARKEIDALGASMKNLQDKGKMEQPTQAARKLAEQIQTAENKLGEYKTKLTELTAAGLDYGTDEWIKNQKEIQKCTIEMEKLEHVKKNLINQKGTFQRPVSIKSMIGGAAVKGFGGAIKGVGTGAKSLASGLIQKSSGAFGALIQKFSSGIPIVRRFTGAVKENGNSFGGGLKNLLKYTLGIRSLFVLANLLRSGLTTGFNNLAQYSTSTNASLSTLMSSLTQLKNSFAAAFTPILEVVAPILNSFIQMIIQAVNAVGQLMGALTGKSTIVKAKKVNQDYAASLNGTSSGLKDNASNANKAQKEAEKYKRTLLGFDQINKMDDDSSSDTGSSGGSNAGGLGGVDDMFETTAVNSKFKDLAKLIKDSWKNADFTEVGAIVGRKLNAALQNIPWDEIKSTANKIAKSIATFLNGFIETTDWGLVGSTISQGLNTAFGFVNTFATNFHWGSLGDAIGNGLNEAMDGLDWNLIQNTVHNVVAGLIDTLNHFIETTDWTKVGVTIGNYFNTKLEAFYTAVHNFDWRGLGTSIANLLTSTIQTIDTGKIGQVISDNIKGLFNMGIGFIEGVDWPRMADTVCTKVKDFLGGIDWAGIASSVFELIGAGFGGAVAFISELCGNIVTGAKKYIINHFTEAGDFTWEGFVKGVTDSVKGIAGWIKDNIFAPFINGFKKAFGIHSPSTVMAEQGGFIMSGLFKGLKDNLPNILTWVGNLPKKVKDKLGNAKDWLKDKGKQAIEGFAAGLKSIHIPLPHISVSWNSHTVGPVSFSTPSFGLNWYAKGGFPEMGEMFVARENGPEMVGRMGRKNVVANNNQIIDGIRAGVFEAMRNALESFGGENGQNTEIKVYLEGDSKKLFKVIRTEGQDYQKSTGKPVFD